MATSREVVVLAELRETAITLEKQFQETPEGVPFPECDCGKDKRAHIEMMQLAVKAMIDLLDTGDMTLWDQQMKERGAIFLEHCSLLVTDPMLILGKVMWLRLSPEERRKANYRLN